MSENIDKDILLKAVRNTIKELFPHNQKYFVLHDNTDNNHVHVTIGKTSLIFKIINAYILIKQNWLK